MLTMPLNLEAIKKEIVEQLKPLDPEKVILFGSYAYGQPTEESDIDLYIVTRDDFIPQSYAENMQHYLKVTKFLSNFKKRYATDLIVHTKAMHNRFCAMESSFSRQIMTHGVRLL